MKKTDDPIIVEESFFCSIEKAWRALTYLPEMKFWYFDNIDSFKPEVGAKSEFPVQSGERTFTHLWKVTEVKQLEKIVYNWKYREYCGDSFVSFELFEMGENVDLKLSVEITEDFSDEIPEFRRESCVNGWDYFIGRLKEYLEK